ncbi:MAG: 50S ribosomal protein L24 [Nitrospiraceae bacterium]|nr:50S ribosomal protein L24 [Nitrospiraceae bacterium]
MSLDIKKEDTVHVLTGKYKGKTGRVLNVDKGDGRVLVEKINIIKKHMKPNKTYSQGGIIEREAPIQRSNVMLVCPKCGKPTKIGATVVQGGEKHRTCKKCKEVID